MDLAVTTSQLRAYSPALCPDGHRPFLTPIAPASAVVLGQHCPTCGQRGRLLSEIRDDEANRAWFENLLDRVQRKSFAPENSLHAMCLLETLTHGPASVSVENALSKCACLRELELHLPNSDAERRGFAALLLALLSSQSRSLPRG